MSYLDLFTQISAQRIDACAEFVADDIRFKDPFNDITGRAQFQKLLRKTLDDVDNPQFEITDQSCSDKGVHYIRWIFRGTVKGLGLWTIEGMSELHYDQAGKVVLHIDHWDAGAQFYERLPIIRWILQKIRARLKIS